MFKKGDLITPFQSTGFTMETYQIRVEPGELCVVVDLTQIEDDVPRPQHVIAVTQKCLRKIVAYVDWWEKP